MGLWDRIAAGEHGYYDVNDDGRIDSFEAGMMMYEREMEEGRNRKRSVSDDFDDLDDLCGLRDLLGVDDLGDFSDF